MKTFIADMSMEDYNQVQGIRSSEIKSIFAGQTPRHVVYRRRFPSKSTEAQSLGTVVHALVSGHLEEFFVKQHNWTTKEGKKERDRYQEEAPDSVLITVKDFEKAKLMASSIMANTSAAGLLEGAVKEGSFFWKEGGQLFKTRPDLVNHVHRVVCDIKTARDASWRGFLRAVKYERYDVQAYTQLRGVASATKEDFYDFWWLVVENVEPFECTLIQCDEDVIAEVASDWEKASEALVHAQATDDWPGYPEVSQPITYDDLWGAWGPPELP